VAQSYFSGSVIIVAVVVNRYTLSTKGMRNVCT